MLRPACLSIAAWILFASPWARADDRAVAEWVLRSGGNVTLDGTSQRVHDIAGLPSGPILVRSVDIVSIVVAPADLNRLSSLSHLRELYLSGRTWHSLPLNVSVKSLGYFAGLTSLETLALSLPVQTEIPLVKQHLSDQLWAPRVGVLGGYDGVPAQADGRLGL